MKSGKSNFRGLRAFALGGMLNAAVVYWEYKRVGKDLSKRKWTAADRAEDMAELRRSRDRLVDWVDDRIRELEEYNKKITLAEGVLDARVAELHAKERKYPPKDQSPEPMM